MQWRRRLRRVPLVLGAAIVAVVLACAAFAPLIAPYGEGERDPAHALEEPSAAHPFGTDEDGADLLSRVIWGARVAVVVGFGTVLVSAALGVLVGCIAGWYGGIIDEILMRLLEILLSFPGILLAIFIIFLTQEPSVWSVILALSVTGWAGYARLVRGQVLVVREQEFVTAARGLGASTSRIIGVHLLPNVMAPVVVQATFGVAGAILAEASLSFLGLGPQEASSWGAILDQGAVLFIKTPYVAVSAGLAIAITILGVNLLGDALRDRLDPRST
jgi:peptide/nickel transport system permease protein